MSYQIHSDFFTLATFVNRDELNIEKEILLIWFYYKG